RGKFVLVHLAWLYPAVVVHADVADLAAPERAGVDAEVDVVVRVRMLHMDHPISHLYVDPHLLLELAGQRGFVGFSLFDPPARKFPEQREGCRWAALGDEVLAVPLDHRGYDADLGRHDAGP